MSGAILGFTATKVDGCASGNKACANCKSFMPHVIQITTTSLPTLRRFFHGRDGLLAVNTSITALNVSKGLGASDFIYMSAVFHYR